MNDPEHAEVRHNIPPEDSVSLEGARGDSDAARTEQGMVEVAQDGMTS
jgi:hypothetical protein